MKDDPSHGAVDTPLVSIVIPTYNRWPLVQETVESALQQDFDSIEVIVVDDGSADGTAENVRNKYPGTRVIAAQNGERGAARNHGAREASGAFLAFVDSDDVLEPWYVSQFVEAWHAWNRRQGMYVCPYAVWHPDSGTMRVPARSLPARADMLEAALRGTLWPPDCAFLPRTSFLAMGGFPEERTIAGSEDWAFLVRMLATDIPVKILARPGVRLREHAGRSVRDDLAVIASRQAALSFLIDQGLPGRPLETRERLLATAGTYRFCAAHAYHAGEMRQARSYLWALWRTAGWRAALAWSWRLWGQTWLSPRAASYLRNLRDSVRERVGAARVR